VGDRRAVREKAPWFSAAAAESWFPEIRLRGRLAEYPWWIHGFTKSFARRERTYPAELLQNTIVFHARYIAAW